MSKAPSIPQQAQAAKEDPPAKVPSHIKHIFESAQSHHAKNMVTILKPSWMLRKPEGTVSYEISIAEMQRFRLRKLQCKLVGHAVMIIQGKEPNRWEEDLDKFTELLQAHDYMAECSAHRRDPFIVTGTRSFDRKILDAYMPQPAVQEDLEKADAEWTWDDVDVPVAPPRSHYRHSHLIARLGVAVVGAGFLIGPMWLMMVQSGFYLALGSTTGFVLAFGVLMAVVLDRNNDVLASTSAYAAVLVVFVALVRGGPHE